MLASHRRNVATPIPWSQLYCLSAGHQYVAKYWVKSRLLEKRPVAVEPTYWFVVRCLVQTP